MTYERLDEFKRAQMIEMALLQLEEQRFEAEINAIQSGKGMKLLLPGPETAGERIERIDRAIMEIKDKYQDLLTNYGHYAIETTLEPSDG